MQSGTVDADPTPDSSDEKNVIENGKEPTQDTSRVIAPYSIFTKREKWTIVGLAALGGFFSPMTANIYFPALPTLTKAFHETTENLNLTVTMYMVMQGVAPMVWGTLSDRYGRRPQFIGCMLFLALTCVGLALTPTDAFWLLMLLRCLQAFGSASTIALGGGVIGDIATPQERGGFFGVFSAGPMIGPNLGPVLGGILSQTLGWRSIFWFLCIGSALCAVVMILVLPETLRSIVGNGSVRPPAFWRPLIPVVGRSLEYSDTKPPPKPLRNPFVLFTYLDVLALLLFNGVLYAVFYGVTATISELFQTAYPSLNETEVGLCYLAIGGGMLIGTVTNGRLLDYEYQVIKRSIIRKAERDPEKEFDWEEFVKADKYPIEKARLRSAFIYTAIFIATTFGYGWSLQAKVNLACPLILQFIIGFSITSCMNTITTLIVDLFPTQGSSITACNNLVRCSLGAAMVSAMDPIITAVGPGWAYVILGGISVAVTPFLFIEVAYGPKWRERRRLRLAQEDNQ
ncbi:unnamed protein product [Peniophora sp. CBMAI 1063]|nr:unnamed protein product [Peniophora sp. CBMAI 1063]